MRDPERISRICQKLEQTWKMFPDMRLGQLITNILGTDPFYIEDDEAEKKIEEWCKWKENLKKL